MSQPHESEILPREVYEFIRASYLRCILELKRRRRIVLGAHVSLLFESRATVVYQIHELLRAGGNWSGRCIAREVAEHQGLAPTGAAITATLMIHGGPAAEQKELSERLSREPGDVVRFRIGPHVMPAAAIIPAADAHGPVHYLRFAAPADFGRRVLDLRQSARVELYGSDLCAITSLPEATRRELAGDRIAAEATQSRLRDTAAAFA